MPYNSPLPSFTDGVSTPSATDLNKYVQNMEYLHAPVKASYEYAGADMTTTSTNWASMGANWELTITTVGGHVFVLFYAMGQNISIDIDIDGTQWTSTTAGGKGAIQYATASNKVNMMLPIMKYGLSAGSHTFKAMWRVPASATGTIYGTYGARFYVREYR